MNQIVQKFSDWTERETSATPLIQFRVAFASIWLVYDCLDWFTGGTQAGLWLSPDFRISILFSILQFTLIFSELGLISGFRPMVFGGIALFGSSS